MRVGSSIAIPSRTMPLRDGLLRILQRTKTKRTQTQKKINSISDYVNFIHHLICAIVGRSPNRNGWNGVRVSLKMKKNENTLFEANYKLVQCSLGCVATRDLRDACDGIECPSTN